MMGIIRLFLPIVFAATTAFAQPLLTTTEGTTWEYAMTQEVGKGISLGDVKPDADGKVHMTVMYRVGDEEKIDGKSARRFEMHRGGVVSNTDVLAVDDRAITCYARIGENNEKVKIDPPQKMLMAPIQIGTKWDYDGTIEDTKVHQTYKIAAEEDVQVPAGNFHSFRVHLEQTAGGPPITVDRWFVPGVGFVKDETTMKFPNGDLLQHLLLELKATPRTAPRPEVKATAAPKKLSVGLAQELTGEVTTSFTGDFPKIYARWQGNGLSAKAKIRAVWIAEDVGAVAPPNYKVDEATVTANRPDQFGTFTISRPNKGWPVGKYRAEFYVGDELTETVKFTIGNAAKEAESAPAPGKVTTEEGKKFADELAAEETVAGSVSIPRSDGAMILSLQTEDDKPVKELPEGAKRIRLHSELKGNESTTLKVVYNGPGDDGFRKLGESRVYLAKSKPVENTWINPAGGHFATGKYRVDIFLEEKKVGELSFEVSGAEKK